MHTLVRTLRILRRSPAFLALSISSLALAIGVTTAVFAVVEAVLRPVTPFRNAQSLYHVFVFRPPGRAPNAAISVPEALDALRRRSALIADVELSSSRWLLIEARGFLADGVVHHVTPHFFPMLGVRAEAGRLFSPATASRDDGTSAVISVDVWQRAFAGTRDFDGLTVTADGRVYNVIGVAPRGTSGGDRAALWLVASAHQFAAPHAMSGVQGFIRLRLGADAGQVRDDANAVAAELARGRSELTGMRIATRPLVEAPEALRDIHLALIIAAITLLAIACANLSNLVLARALGREREIAIRLALGARRRHVVTEIVLECLVVALAGGLLGLVLAFWGLTLLEFSVPSNIPIVGTLQFRLDWRVACLTLCMSAATALAFGLAPALRVTRGDLTGRLKDGSGSTTGRTRGRFSALVVAEVMLSLALLSGAGLLVRASRHVRDLDFGYNRKSLVEGSLVAPRGSDQRQADLQQLALQAVERARHIPGVRDAAWRAGVSQPALSVTSALAGGGNHTLYRPHVVVVSASYLSTLGIDVVRGRDFTAGDDAGGGVAIVDERAARELWPGESPVGQRLALGDPSQGEGWLPVVGVARRIRHAQASFDFFDVAPAAVYLLGVPPGRSMEIVANAATTEIALVKSGMRRMLQEFLPQGYLGYVHSPNEVDGKFVIAHRFIANVFVVLAVLALTACALGMFCVLSYAVSCREREYALRVALGATRCAILGEVVREATVMTLAGTALGAFVAMWSSAWLEPFLFDLYRVDALTLVGAEVVLVVTVVAASLVPALRATRGSAQSLMRSA